MLRTFLMREKLVKRYEIKSLGIFIYEAMPYINMIRFT